MDNRENRPLWQLSDKAAGQQRSTAETRFDRTGLDAWMTRSATPQAMQRQRVPGLAPARSARSAAARSKVSELVKPASTPSGYAIGGGALSGHTQPRLQLSKQGIEAG